MADISPIPETKITFFKSSGHRHDGLTSSIIDTSKYSIFDFGTDITTGSQDRARELTRTNNQNRFNQYIANFISTQVLAPAGIELLENSVRGIHIGANEITANEIAANTITANEITAGTITATQIAANTITSNEIQTGTITASDLASTITFNAQLVQSSQYAANSLTGWALLANGDSTFNSGTFRGSLAVTGNISAGSTAIYANGAIATGNFNVTSLGVLSATGANISGQVNAGNTTIYSNGAIVTSNFNVTSLGVLTATGVNISGQINASSGTFSGSITANGTITGGTISGATITGGTVQTATSGQRITLSGTELNLFEAAAGGATASINFARDGLNLATSGIINATGTLTINAAKVTGSYTSITTFGYYAGGFMNGLYHQGTLTSSTTGTTFYRDGQIVAYGTNAAQISLAQGAGPQSPTYCAQFRLGGSEEVYLRNRFDNAYVTFNALVCNDASSRKYKNSIENYSLNNKNILNTLLQINIVNFKYNNDEKNSTNIGVIAEEIVNLVPEAVSLNNDNEPESVSGVALASFSIAACQKLLERIEFLEAKLGYNI
jgi:hypothetical protein